MKKRNGFTLIELLAVIVILAVIALIAVPRIIEILNKARLSAAEDSTMGIVEAAESYVASFMLQNHGAIPSENLVFECSSEGCLITTNLEGYDKTNLEKLNYKGKNASSGNITISNSGKSIQATNLNINGFTCNYLNDEAYCGKKEYNSGDPYELGGYDWHVISDDGKYLTLLMDAGQLSDMNHCTNDTVETTDCGVYNGYMQYGWEQSLIRKYLNEEFLNLLESKIGTDKLVEVEICKDRSLGGTNIEYPYGGYLKSEMDRVGITCQEGYTKDKVRLITVSEYYNLSPYYQNIELPYFGSLGWEPNSGYIPKIDTITRVTDTDWLYSNLIGDWWTMNSYASKVAYDGGFTRSIQIDGTIKNFFSHVSKKVRPVIQILKN